MCRTKHIDSMYNEQASDRKQNGVIRVKRIVITALTVVLLLCFTLSASALTPAEAQKLFPQIPSNEIQDWLPDIAYTLILEEVKNNGPAANVYAGGYYKDRKNDIFIYLISEEASKYVEHNTLQLKDNLLSDKSISQVDQSIIEGLRSMRDTLEMVQYEVKSAKYLYRTILDTMDDINAYYVGPDNTFGQKWEPYDPIGFSSAEILEIENTIRVSVDNLSDINVEWFRKNVSASPVIEFVNNEDTDDSL